VLTVVPGSRVGAKLALVHGVESPAGGLDLRQVVQPPLGEVGEQAGQAAAEFADLVLDPRRHLGVLGAHDKPIAFELP